MEPIRLLARAAAAAADAADADADAPPSGSLSRLGALRR